MPRSNERRASGLAGCLAERLVGVDGPVVLLLDEGSADGLQSWVDAFGAERVTVLAEPGTAADPSVRWLEVAGRGETAEELAKLGACAAVVDEVAADPVKQLARWARFGSGVRQGGRYVVRATLTPEQWRALVEQLGDDVDEWAREVLAESSETCELAARHLLLPQRRAPGVAGCLAERLVGMDGPVVLLLDEGSVDGLQSWIDAFGAERLAVLAEPGTAADPSVRWLEVAGRRETADELAKLGPCAAVVDEVAADPVKQLVRWARFGLGVRPGGRYVMRATLTPEQWRAMVDQLGDDVDEWTREMVAESLAGCMLAAGHLLLPQQRRLVLKVNERTADVFLPRRTPDLLVTTIASRPATTVDTHMRVFSHGSEDVFIPHSPFEAPPLTCRWYRGTVEARASTLTMHGLTALPPSFRHAWGRTRNVELLEIGRRLAEWPMIPPSSPLAGDYFDLNAYLPGHFGHVMTESVAKLWAWDEAKAAVPGLKGLYRLPEGAGRPTFEVGLFEAFGVSERDIHWATSDVTLESYVSPTIPWHNARPHHYHPEIRSVWDRIRKTLVVSGSDTPARIFVSRGHGDRGCSNQAEVEAWFEQHGFTVVYPERHTLSDQATLFANARVVAGFAGSAMFNLLFSEGIERLIVLTHDHYVARNEWLFGACLAEELHYFWAKPDMIVGPGMTSSDAFHSTWAFDFEAHAAELEEAAR